MKNASDQENNKTFFNSDDAINQNFDLQTHENDDYSVHELFVDEDKGDDNESSDKDAPTENQ